MYLKEKMKSNKIKDLPSLKDGRHHVWRRHGANTNNANTYLVFAPKPYHLCVFLSAANPPLACSLCCRSAPFVCTPSVEQNTRHVTACSAHRPNHMEEMITGQEIAEPGQRKQSFCTGLSQSCPLSHPATWPLSDCFLFCLFSAYFILLFVLIDTGFGLLNSTTYQTPLKDFFNVFFKVYVL